MKLKDRLMLICGAAASAVVALIVLWWLWSLVDALVEAL